MMNESVFWPRSNQTTVDQSVSRINEMAAAPKDRTASRSTAISSHPPLQLQLQVAKHPMNQILITQLASVSLVWRLKFHLVSTRSVSAIRIILIKQLRRLSESFIKCHRVSNMITSGSKSDLLPYHRKLVILQILLLGRIPSSWDSIWNPSFFFFVQQPHAFGVRLKQQQKIVDESNVSQEATWK